MDLIPSGQDIITATYTAVLALIGWGVNTQITTNKTLSKTLAEVSVSLAGAIQEFRSAIQIFDQREKNRQQTCEFHKAQTAEMKKHVDNEIRKIKHEFETLKTKQK